MYLLFTLSSASFVFAQSNTITELQNRITEKSAEIKKIEEEIRLYESQIEATGKEATSLKSTIKKLEATKAKLSADIKVTEKKIQSTSFAIEKLRIAIKEKGSAIGTGMETLGLALKKTNELDLRSPIEILLAKEKLYESWNDIEDLSKFQGKVDEELDRLQKLKEELEVDKNQTEKEKKNLVGFKSDLSDQQKIIEANKKEQSKVLTETQNKEAIFKQQLTERLKKKEELEIEIADFESQLRVTIDPSLLPKTGSKALSWPTDVPFITQHFGNTPFATKNAQVYNGAGHNGIDLRASPGTPIKNAASGVVVDTGDTDQACYGVSYGKWVLVRHNNGLATLYAHLSLIKVSAGQIVTRGEVVGYSGNTGYSTGPHLHFTVYAGDAVRVSGPTEYRSKVCKTYMKIPISPRNGYLNPLSYL